MKNNNLYKGEINVSTELDEFLRSCFLNHLVIYNYFLEVLNKNPEFSYKVLKEKCFEYIVEKNITQYLGSPLFNELYYLFKKFKKNNKSAKALTDIHYITFFVTGYNNKNFSKDGNLIILKDAPGAITLLEELPEIDYTKGMIYFNISYSNNESKYRLSIYQ